MHYRNTLLLALSGLIVTLTGCSLGYPDMAGEWHGTCDAGGTPYPFEIFSLNEYQGAGYVNGATGEHVVYPHSANVQFQGEWWDASAQSIYCLDEGGCSLGENELEDVPVDFGRFEITFYNEDRTLSYRMIADAVHEKKKAIEGNCWQSYDSQWGTFSAERVQNPWVDGHETEQTHPSDGE